MWLRHKFLVLQQRLFMISKLYLGKDMAKAITLILIRRLQIWTQCKQIPRFQIDIRLAHESLRFRRHLRIFSCISCEIMDLCIWTIWWWNICQNLAWKILMWVLYFFWHLTKSACLVANESPDYVARIGVTYSRNSGRFDLISFGICRRWF